MDWQVTKPKPWGTNKRFSKIKAESPSGGGGLTAEWRSLDRPILSRIADHRFLVALDPESTAAAYLREADAWALRTVSAHSGLWFGKDFDEETLRQRMLPSMDPILCTITVNFSKTSHSRIALKPAAAGAPLPSTPLELRQCLTKYCLKRPRWSVQCTGILFGRERFQLLWTLKELRGTLTTIDASLEQAADADSASEEDVEPDRCEVESYWQEKVAAFEARANSEIASWTEKKNVILKMWAAVAAHPCPDASWNHDLDVLDSAIAAHE